MAYLENMVASIILIKDIRKSTKMVYNCTSVSIRWKQEVQDQAQPELHENFKNPKLNQTVLASFMLS